MLTVNPQRVRVDATSLVTYQGTPNRTVKWTLTGSGTLTPLSAGTDAAGMAGALYTPGTVGDTVVIRVDAGA